MEKHKDNLTWSTDRKDLVEAVRKMSKEAMVDNLKGHVSPSKLGKLRLDQMANTLMIKLISGEVSADSVLK
jgi:hypothetical protein